jgi:histidinol dehydrogenase
MLPIYDVNQARNTILKRTGIDQIPVSPSMSDRLERMFGQPTTPEEAVKQILLDVREQGDAGLRSWTQKLDGVELQDFRVPVEEIQAALDALDPDLKDALLESACRIRAFYERQPKISWIDSSMGGMLGQMLHPLDRVGIYVPGGTAPLPSTVLMSAIPAVVAGVKQVVIVTPPDRTTGKANPVTLAAAAISQVDEVYLAGGAQAIGALAYGTESIARVEKIVGPGNLFVTLAKKQVYGLVGIDGLAGPTETIVIADERANPLWAAADMMAQAEHDVLATAILLTPSRLVAEAVQAEIQNRVQSLPRAEIITESLTSRGGAVITQTIEQAIELSNQYGPEHLNLAVADPWKYMDLVTCAGGLFLGENSCEVMGDYIAGPSHVMPTGGTAHFASPLNVWDFVRMISLVGLNAETASRLGSQADRIARAEGLDAHALAGRLRSIKN